MVHGAYDGDAQKIARQKPHKHIISETPGGIQMQQILDRVLEKVKEHISSQESGAAIWILERIIEVNPRHSEAHHELGMLYYEQDELAKAQSHLHQAVRFGPDNSAFYKDLGDFFHVVHKDSANALEMYEKAVQLNPSEKHLLLTAAHLCIVEKSFENAMAYYQRVLDVEPENVEAQSCLDKLKGGIETGAGDQADETLYRQSQTQIESGDRKGAAVSLLQLLDKHPEHALAHNDYAVLAYEAGDKDSALRHYEKAVSISPQNLLFVKNLADFYWWEKNDSKAAMERYVQILDADPKDVETLLSCAQICMTLGKNADAREFVDRAGQVDPSNEGVRKLRNQMAEGQDSHDPQKDPNGLHREAQLRAAEGDLEGAVEVLTRLVSEHCQDAEAFNDLGVLYFELGQKEKALSCYREAVQLEPAEDTFCKNLADFYLIEQGRAEDAMKLYLSVLENNPRDVDSLVATGFVCMSMNKTDDARVFFERAMEIEPLNQVAQQALDQLDGVQVDNCGDEAPIKATWQSRNLKAVGQF
jgi:tetratricopeptide (TPR) repeat protein